MRYSVAVVISFLLMVPFPVSADSHVAVTKTLSGDVSVLRFKTTVIPNIGYSIFKGDMIQTGESGSAGITFKDGTRISIGPSSKININDYLFIPGKKEYAFDVFLEKGSAVYSSGKLGKLSPESVRFDTPRATVGIRGTRFLVEVD